MGRSNAIVVGAVVLGPLILGLEGYAAYRSHHHQRATEVTEPPPTTSPEAEDQPAPAPVAEVPPAAPPADQPAQAEPPPPEVETVEAVAPPQDSVLWQRFLEHRGKVIQTADEQVFDLLNLPDTQRAAIRTIDEQFARALATDSDPNAEQARRAAVADVLGPDVARTFNFDERKAERRARGQLRAQLVRGE